MTMCGQSAAHLRVPTPLSVLLLSLEGTWNLALQAGCTSCSEEREPTFQ